MKIAVMRGAALAIAAAVTLVGAVAAGAAASAAPARALTVSTAGCPSGVALHTPATRGGALTADALGVPQAAPILDQINAHHVRWLTSLDCESTNLVNGSVPSAGSTSGPASATASPEASASTEQTYNWSGYDSATSLHDYAQMEWVEPNVTLPSGLSEAHLSIWPGMGGENCTQLIQAGTEADVTSSGQSHVFWFELYPQEPEQVVTNLSVNPGDDVFSAVEFSSGTAYFYLCNYTQNVCEQPTQTSPAAGPTAEWIVERPSVNGSISALADFGTVSIQHAAEDQSDGQVGPLVGDSNPNEIQMYANDQSTLLAQPTAIDSDDHGRFAGIWYAAGP